MQIEVQGHPCYCYSGGKAFDATLPTLVFIHGVLCDHSVWTLQSRNMARNGWNVLAVDLPGHGRSGGKAPESVEQAADFIAALLDAAHIERAALVGHSWGSLIALQTAAHLGQHISHLALAGTACPMKVSPALLQMAQSAPDAAIRMVATFSRHTLAPPSGAGWWAHNGGIALGQRILRSNPQVNLLHQGLLACDRYTSAPQAIAAIACPVLFALGMHDQMTPPKAAQTLITAARATGKRVMVRHLPSGHNLMTEAPEETLLALQEFLLNGIDRC